MNNLRCRNIDLVICVISVMNIHRCSLVFLYVFNIGNSFLPQVIKTSSVIIMNSPHSKTSVFTDLLRMSCRAICGFCARFGEQYEHPVLYERKDWVFKDVFITRHHKTPIMSSEFRLLVQKASFVRLSLGRGFLLEGTAYYCNKYQNVDIYFKKCQVNNSNQYRKLLCFYQFYADYLRSSLISCTRLYIDYVRRN